MPADDELMLRRLGDALVVDRTPDPARVTLLREAAADARSTVPSATATRAPRARPARRAVVLGAAAAIVVALGIGVVTRDPGTQQVADGVLEFTATLRAPDGKAVADVTGTRAGVGRMLELRTDELPILPTGQYYEVWFVGPGDSPLSPNRISAGTFHPDELGRTDVVLTAAVDPSKYPELSVTAERGDGDPRPSDTEVLRGVIVL
jgi:hypothetical protein